MPTPRTESSASVVNGKIYVLGGYPNRTLNEVYDPSTDTWTAKAAMPIEQFFEVSEVYDNEIYVFGGRYERGSFAVYYHSFTQIYNIENNTWRVGLPTPHESQIPLSAGMTTGFLAPKRIYVFAASTNQVYNPAFNDRSYGADVPTERGEFAVAVVDDLIYVIGGWGTSYVPPLLEMKPFGSGVKTFYYGMVEQYTPFGYGKVPPLINIAYPMSWNYASSEIPLNFTINRAFD